MRGIISVVIPCANDNYGLFLEERAILALDSMISNDYNVILIDWGSPNGVPLLEDIRPFLRSTGLIKSIIVPIEFTQKVAPISSGNQSCCEVLARNIGIRRSTTDWILSTNIDIILGGIETEKLDSNTLYTARKYNVPEIIHLIQLHNMPHEMRYQMLLNNKDKLEQMKYMIDVDPMDKASLIVGCGDFQLAHKTIWDQVRGFEETLTKRSFADTNLQLKVLHSKGHKISVLEEQILFHLDHKSNIHSMNKHGAVLHNDKAKATQLLTKTENSDTWGFQGMLFPTLIH